MAGIIGLKTHGPGRRWRRVTAWTAMTAAFMGTMPAAVLAEGEVCTAQSCSGSIAATTTTGSATSSDGVAVSGTGHAYGGVASIGAGQGVAHVGDPTTGDRIGLDNTGVALTITAPESIASLAYSPPAEVIAEKQALLHKALPEVHYQAVAATAGLDPHLADSACPDGKCFDWTYTRSQWLTHQIKHYYCGPATAQLMLNSLGFSTNQTYLAERLYTEKQNATALHDLVKVLNDVQNEQFIWRKATFTAQRLPKDDPLAYMTLVILSAYNGMADKMGHGVVNNVSTAPLSYWGDKSNPASHFNISHGFTFGVGVQTIDVAEEYDPWKVGVKRKTNPYGYHRVPLDQIYQANLENKVNRGVVIW